MNSREKRGPRHLHPKVKLIWLAPSAIALLLLWLMGSFFLVVVQPEAFPTTLPRILIPFILLLAILIFLGLPIYGYLHLEYSSFTFELTAEEVVIREGILTRKTTLIPYNRIQNINTRRTVLERLLGLATLQMETAGANIGVSEGILPGIADKEVLIAEILGHVEQAKRGHDIGLGGANGAHPSSSESELLSEILKELVQLNKNISAHYGRGSHAEGSPPHRQ